MSPDFLHVGRPSKKSIRAPAQVREFHPVQGRLCRSKLPITSTAPQRRKGSAGATEKSDGFKWRVTYLPEVVDISGKSIAGAIEPEGQCLAGHTTHKLFNVIDSTSIPVVTAAE
jgi:hypothetical protein